MRDDGWDQIHMIYNSLNNDVRFKEIFAPFVQLFILKESTLQFLQYYEHKLLLL